MHSYEMDPTPVPVMSWEQYAGIVQDRLNGLLSSQECDEQPFQRLVEQHPCLLPWMYGTFGGGHHGLIYNAVISQPRLTGLDARQPDFLMLTRDTGSVYAVLIEIESPCKKWFTKAGIPNAKFVQAMNQLRQWKAWFAHGENTVRFLKEYEVPDELIKYRAFEQRYLLIYGRRADVENSTYAAIRQQHQQFDERFMSWDSLSPTPQLSDALTAQVDKYGYHAVMIQPTIKLGPGMAAAYTHIKDKQKAVANTRDIAPARAKFLCRRWAYWDEWANRDKEGFFGTDEE